jgi:two-component system chemotaxis sensor kinase CheA
MSFSEDEEILQDFLVEASEILELVSEQLVELEQSPDDKNLLNAIFRGFHTVKGGAGFLQLDNMVECCHVTENLFDSLRNGQRDVTPELMDVVLKALDAINEQFFDIQQKNSPKSANPALIAALNRLVAGEDVAELKLSSNGTSDRPSGAGDTSSDGVGQAGDAITDSEFEQLVDAVSNQPAGAPALPLISSSPIPSSLTTGSSTTHIDAIAAFTEADGEISDDEFEALLDQLHGQGKAPTQQATPTAALTVAEPSSATAAGGNPTHITDDEFDDLLDQLHGRGKGPTAGAKLMSSHAAGAPSYRLISDALPAPQKTVPKPAPVSPARDQIAPAAETTVRVDTQRLDDIMNMVGELVLVRNRLVRLGDKSADEELTKAVANLDVVTADLQTSVMKTRMQPIKKVFGRFPRVVRDLARNLKKEIILEMVGEDTDLDKNLVEALADPLVHLVRNSVDHGIELPSVRTASGKDSTGKIILAAQQEGDHILLSITDDGIGMDADKLRGIAIAKGLMDEDAAQRLSDSEAFNLIFVPGFSTKTEISDVSGRGVGMDVVKTKIMQLNGSIAIKSILGEGTIITIKVPLTLAIMPTLMIMVGRQAFALPLVSVDEIFHMDLSKTNIVDGQECITVRDRAIPIFNLKHWLIRNIDTVDTSTNEAKASNGHVVIVSVGTQRVGFVVDQLIGQEEVVIKPLGKMLSGTPGMAGATITGDGTIALIIDVPSMLKRYAGKI